MPLIHENCKTHQPPRWMRATVERLLASLSPEHIGALEAIVLSDAAAIGKGKTQRIGKRKYHARECRGFYHPATRNQRAWIELVIDNIVTAKSSRLLLWFQFVRDYRVSRTLYHEIGHHLDATVGSATRGGEAAADDWCQRLSRIHFRKKYWYLRPVVRLLLPLVRALRKT